MMQDIRQLWSLLTTSQRRQVLTLQWLVLLMALMEVIGVASILPFMTIVNDNSLLEGNGWLASLYQNSGLSTPSEFLFWAGLAVLGLLTSSSIISMLTTWSLTHFAQRLGAELSIRLFRYYLHRPWPFHSTHHSATLTHQIGSECHRVMAQVITPLLQMNARVATATLILIMVFAVNPVAASVGTLLFLGIYTLLFSTVRHYLTRTGERAGAMGKKKMKLMTEGFGGIRELLVLGRQDSYLREFEHASQELAQQQSRMNSIAQLPRYLIELTAYGAILMLVLYLLSQDAGNSAQLLPTLALYALAGFKLLPAFQQIYANLAQIRANLPALRTIREDLMRTKEESDEVKPSTSRLQIQKSIAFKDVTFTYPGKQEPALNGFSLSINARQAVGIVGPSGAGKTTCIEVLLGLLQPGSGKLLVDDQQITDENRRPWQNCLGYVPQSIFLSDASMRQNIAFGVPDKEIDEERLQLAISMAHIGDIIQNLPQGLNTHVGERGVQLSGGQRQRIGIARALYHNPELIVLDEATNALDAASETRIMESLYTLMHNKTLIIIAHRLSTVQNCDVIHVIDKGAIVASGTYAELNKTNSLFRSLAKADLDESGDAEDPMI